MISEHARIRILTLQWPWKYPRVGQIWSQIEKLTFSEVWDVPWRILWPLFVAGPSYDEASGVTLNVTHAHHYQHTEVGYNSCHEVDVEVPIGRRRSQSVSCRVSNRGYEEV